MNYAHSMTATSVNQSVKIACDDGLEVVMLMFTHQKAERIGRMLLAAAESARKMQAYTHTVRQNQ